MKFLILYLIVCLSISLCAQVKTTKQPQNLGERYHFTSKGNPMITHHYTADPAALVEGDTLWLFAEHDFSGGQKGYKMKDWLVFSTTDLTNWTEYPVPMKITDFPWAKSGDAYASHAVKRSGKYYWYISTNWSGIGVAVSDRPKGPYKDALSKPLLTNDDCFASSHSWACIDPAIYVDDGDTPWIFWGNRECYYAKLRDNMIEIDGGSYSRSICIDRLYYNPDGIIKRIVMTSEGVN